ncbi:MAG: acyltransferase, partial [Nostocoides sp.]
MTPNARWRLPHRPGLDGVRALAVLGVLLYHGGVDWLPGGFLGVDVFFVLSGFLITSLLLREHEVTGRVNLPDFWFRRACRLLPALVPVVIFVAGYAVTLAPDVVRDRLRGDLFATVGYVANWRFVIADTSYFEQYAAPTPLLHAWSLAIEEQFYLLWPLVLLLLLRRGGGARGTRRLTSLIAGGALASALTMALIYRPGFDPSRVYYGTDTRAQALLVGAAGAVIAVRGGLWAAEPEHRMARWSATMGLTGLVGLAVLGVAARDSAPWLYRGGFVLGALAALALVAGTVGAGSALSRILAGAPLRIVGVASYGIYLWHWPVYVVLTPDRTDLSGPALLMLRLGITALLASVSYVLVEAPIRR